MRFPVGGPRLLPSLLLLALASSSAACRRDADKTRPLTIGVAFETLQTEFWVAGFEIIKEELARRNMRVLEAIADGDANRQLEQIHTFIARRVDGIIIAPKDGHTVIPMIKAANKAGIPIVLANRPPAKNTARSVTIGVDNFGITKATIDHMCTLARKSGRKHKALVLLGDRDMNAIGRRDGFEAGVRDCSDVIEVVSQVPTEWTQEKAMSGTTNAFQAHPDISFIFTSSDFMLPSIVSALKSAGKFKRVNEEDHVLVGAFDGDASAYQMLRDGYLDADGVQDCYYQAKAAVEAIVDARAGRTLPAVVLDPGLVVHQGNLAASTSRMWGARGQDSVATGGQTP